MEDPGNFAERGESGEVAAMRALAGGDDSALNRLMDDWSPRVTAMIYRMTGNASVASDLAQETFVRLYLTRGRYRPGNSPRPFSTWLFGIAANLVRNHLRWRGRHPESPLDDADEQTAPGDPARSADARERGEAIRKAIATLPPDQREVLVLAEYEGLSQAEIAAVAGCSVKAVERRLSHARELLRRELARFLQG